MTNRDGRITAAFRAMVAVAVAGSLTAGIGSVVLADDVSNNLDISVDAVAEVMALNVGGTQGTTSLAITPRGGDGKAGCNLTGSTTLTVSVNSTNTTVAIVSPTSISFSSCGDVKSLTVSPVGIGSTTVSLRQVSNNTGGTFNLVPATFTVNVAPPPNSAPTVNVTGVASAAAYEHGAVPVAGCSATDAEDGASSFAALVSPISGSLSHFGLGTQEASCSYTDGGGLTASSSVIYSIVDSGKPLITLLTRTPANGSGWNNTDVSVTWSCSDAVSGVVADTVTVSVGSEGADQSATGTCTDGAGNASSATETNIDIDKTAPNTTFVSHEPAPNGAGWNNTAVVVTWSCSDGAGSGAVSATISDTIDSEGTDQSATGTCTDFAGNAATATEADINIDTTAPSIAWIGGPAPDSAHVFGVLPAAATCTASDALSGVSGGCHVTGYATTVGTHTMTATATDAAGNTAEQTRSYTVQPWTLRGFYQPVDMNGVWNTVKGGSTVPIKFEVFAGTTELADPSIAVFSVTQVACSTGTGSDEIELTATGGTSLRYDSTAGQFIQNWQTPKQAGACFRVTMRTADGSALTALFKLK